MSRPWKFLYQSLQFFYTLILKISAASNNAIFWGRGRIKFRLIDNLNQHAFFVRLPPYKTSLTLDESKLDNVFTHCDILDNFCLQSDIITSLISGTRNWASTHVHIGKVEDNKYSYTLLQVAVFRYWMYLCWILDIFVSSEWYEYPCCNCSVSVYHNLSAILWWVHVNAWTQKCKYTKCYRLYWINLYSLMILNVAVLVHFFNDMIGMHLTVPTSVCFRFQVHYVQSNTVMYCYEQISV